MTHKLENNYTKEVLALLQNSKAHKCFLNLGIQQRDWEPQGIWLWRPVGFDYRASTELGKQTLGGHKQNFVSTRTQEKGAVTPQETEPDLPVSVQESPVEVRVDSGLLRGQGHWIQQSWEPWVVCWHKSLKEVAITAITPTTVWPQGGNYRELPINRKLDYRFTEHGPAHQSKTQIPPQPVPPIRKLPQASYPHPSEGRWKETTNTEKWPHGSQPCLIQWNCEPCRVGPPKMDGSWWKVLTKHGPLEGEW